MKKNVWITLNIDTESAYISDVWMGIPGEYTIGEVKDKDSIDNTVMKIRNWFGDMLEAQE